MDLIHSNTFVIFIGSLVVFSAGVFIKQWFTKFINHKFDSIYASQERNETERERDNYITMYGQQVICDCLHHLAKSVLKGDNLDELEKANAELDGYRKTLNKTMLEKASKYNIHIEH